MWNKYFKDIRPSDYKDPSLKRQVKLLRYLDEVLLEEDKLKQLTELKTKMIKMYNMAKICPFTKKNCDLSKDGIKESDYSDKGAYWREAYEDPNFMENLDDLWTQVEPLYAELHKYLSIKAKQTFGSRIDISDGLIPDHILVITAKDAITPFRNVSGMEVDPVLKQQRYTVIDLFMIAEEFFLSMGLMRMDISYNEQAGAMITNPKDGRKVLCHANSWTLCDGNTYLIKMCAKVAFADLITIHHEMGHIQYYMQYKHQPYIFREGANPGFHEAIGDAIALSVITPDHLKKIYILRNYEVSEQGTINALMAMAMEKVMSLPFDFILDKWRWEVFSGAVPENKWNSRWWEYKMKYEKIKPPVKRSDETDFDPGIIMHVAAGVPYISDGLKLGCSKHWSETLEIMTGSKKLSAEPILEYFEPLYKFLKAENEKYEYYLRPQPKPNICDLEFKGRMSQRSKIRNDPPFACIQKH
ncbi:hypothetical protein NQ314_012777, partial [Rhamnusium bicolor]